MLRPTAVRRLVLLGAPVLLAAAALVGPALAADGDSAVDLRVVDDTRDRIVLHYTLGDFVSQPVHIVR